MGVAKREVGSRKKNRAQPESLCSRGSRQPVLSRMIHEWRAGVLDSDDFLTLGGWELIRDFTEVLCYLFTARIDGHLFVGEVRS